MLEEWERLCKAHREKKKARIELFHWNNIPKVTVSVATEKNKKVALHPVRQLSGCSIEFRINSNLPI